MSKYIYLIIFVIFSSEIAAQKRTAIQPGDPWPDNNGNHIQAHGGGMIKINGSRRAAEKAKKTPATRESPFARELKNIASESVRRTKT